MTSSSLEIARFAWADVTGLTASIGCAIHCAAMPVIVGYLPAFGLGWLAGQGFHQAMAVLCSLIALAAFVPGWRRHRAVLPACLGLIGIALLSGHAFGSDDCCGPLANPPATGAVCPDCVSCEAAAVAEVAETTSEVRGAVGAPLDLLSRLVTLMGGLFLICAHIFNHQIACRCCSGQSARQKGAA